MVWNLTLIQSAVVMGTCRDMPIPHPQPRQCFDPRAVSAPGAGTAGLRFFDPDSTIYDGRCAGETELRRALTAETLREAGRCGRVRWAG